MAKTPLAHSKKLALQCAKLILDKKAFNLMILDVHSWNGLNDYIVICSAHSSIQAQTIADHIKQKFKEQNVRCLYSEGYPLAKWILLDYNDVIVHIFDEYVRDYYAIENLWIDAPRVKIPKTYYSSKSHGSK